MNHVDILKQQLSEQIALEEHLVKIIEDQISDIDDTNFADAKNLLTKTREALESQFTPLNELLDKLERDALTDRKRAIAGNGGGFKSPLILEQENRRISRILRDDYSALNLITISNTLLHTMALALNCQEVAEIALKHIENLAPLVVKIGELMPEVIARELYSDSPTINQSVAQTALKNIQLAWRSNS